MASRKRSNSRKARKPARKAKLTRPATALREKKRVERRKSVSLSSEVSAKSAGSVPEFKERYVITLESIRGDTAIGDLLVTFPRTREVLARKGLRLEAEDAGDIYMTLDVFSAMNGLEIATLVQEIVEVAKEVPPVIPQVVAAPIP